MIFRWQGPFAGAHRGSAAGPSELSRLRMRALFEWRKRLGPAWRKLRRFLQIPGLKGGACFFRARAEVLRALRTWDLQAGCIPRADTIPAASIPSVAAKGTYDRVLAEIDQDGFAFAVDPLDREFFNQRETRLPRIRHRLEVVLRDGVVCLRKRFLPGLHKAGLKEWFWSRLGLLFYNEAAALLRLRDLPQAPQIRALDVPSMTITMDFIAGETLRRLSGRRGAPIHDLDLAADPVLRRLPKEGRDRREAELYARLVGKSYSGDIRDLMLEMNRRGVAPQDVKLGNVIIGARTQKPYWVDFEQACLDFSPEWEEHLHEQYVKMNDSFDLDLATRTDVREYVGKADQCTPVDFGFLGYVGDVSDVSAGEGRWRWLLKDMTGWRGKRVLDLGAGNCLYALRMLQEGAAEAHCVERDAECHRQARFVRSAVEQMEGRTFPLTIHQTDMHAFLTSTPFPEEYFDLTLALCSLYYLEQDAIAESMKVIGRISKECWLQANVGTPRDAEDLMEKASTAFLEKQLRAAGFDDVRVICPKGYMRPLLIGKKSVRPCEQGPSVR